MIHWMKSVFASVFFLFSLQSVGQAHEITIKVSGLENEQVIVGYHLGKQRLVYDTIQSTGEGEVMIKGVGELPQGVYFLYANTFYFEFLIKEQQFQLSLDKTTAYSSMTVEGSVENELFGNFQRQMGVLQREQKQLADSLNGLSGDDSIAVRQKFVDIAQEMSLIRSSMVETHEGTFFSDFLGLMVGLQIPAFDSIEDQTARKFAQYEYYQNHYFDVIPDPGKVMRTPVVHDYVMKFFNEVVVPQPDSINAEIDRFLLSTMANQESFRYWLVTLFNHYQESKIMGMDAVTVHLAEKYYLSGLADWVTEESKTEIRKEMRFMKPNLIGQPAPDMVLVDTSLSSFSVRNIPSDYLIVFFYDPDCGVCRKKTPVLKDAYEELQAEGADVLAVCTISDIEKWKDYIQKNSLEWYNAADPKGRSTFRVDYNVRSTPQVFVLDRERKIIAKKLDVSQLLGFIRDHKSLQNP